MERIVAFINAVKAGKFPNASTMAVELEVSPKTIQRDIAFIRDRLCYPLEYDGKHFGYFFSEEVTGMDDFEVQVEDLAALFIAQQTMGQLKGTKIAEAMQPVFERLARLCDGRVNLSGFELKEVFSMQNRGVKEADLSIFGMVTEAVMRQRELDFLYKGMNQDVERRRLVQPYHVGEVGGGWYMIGLDVEKKLQRTFALQRMSDCHVRKICFERPEGLQVSFAGGIGVWSSDQIYEVELEVSGWVFQLIQERVWHHSQEVEILDKGAKLARLKLQVSALEELVSLVLSWGSNVKIVSPKELLQLVRSEVRHMQHN